MRIQQDAFNVLQRTSRYLNSNVLDQQPAWYKVVAQYPPNKDLTKKIKSTSTAENQHAIYINKKRSTLYKTKVPPKNFQNKIFKISKLKFLEDELRQLFYDQHPWELATPKNLIENPYLNHKELDWSRIQQLYKKLDGDSVVQRAIYLVQTTPELSILEAYDQARLEYYRLKMELDSETSVSQEEATMSGAVFEPTVLEKGFNLEQKFLDKWRDDAVAQTMEFEAKMSQSFGKANADGGSNSDQQQHDVDIDDNDVEGAISGQGADQARWDIAQLNSFEDVSKR